MIALVKSIYSAVGRVFEKQTKTIEDQGKKVDSLQIIRHIEKRSYNQVKKYFQKISKIMKSKRIKPN